MSSRRGRLNRGRYLRSPGSAKTSLGLQEPRGRSGSLPARGARRAATGTPDGAGTRPVRVKAGETRRTSESIRLSLMNRDHVWSSENTDPGLIPRRGCGPGQFFDFLIFWDFHVSTPALQTLRYVEKASCRTSRDWGGRGRGPRQSFLAKSLAGRRFSRCGADPGATLQPSARRSPGSGTGGMFLAEDVSAGTVELPFPGRARVRGRRVLHVSTPTLQSLKYVTKTSRRNRTD